MVASRALLASLGVAACLACVPEPPARAAEEAKPIAKPEPSKPEVPAGPEAPPKPSTSGLGFVNLQGVGIQRLDPEGWRPLHTPRGAIFDLIEIRGKLHVLSNSGVQRLSSVGPIEPVAELDRETWTALGKPRVLAGDGEVLWVLGKTGVGRWSGAWETTPLESIASAPADGPADLVVDASGVPWLLWGGVHRWVDSAWAPVDLPPGADQAVDLLETKGPVLVHAGCTSGLCTVLRYGDGPEPEIRTLAAEGCTDYDTLGRSPTGKYLALAGRCGVFRWTEGATPDLKLTRAEGWHGQPVRSLAVDAGGRVWVGTNNGLTIIDAEGGVEDYPQSRLSDMSGMVTDIVLRGDGPPPPFLGPERHASLVGTAVRLVNGDKQAVANAKIELCNKLPPTPGDSPCAGSEGRRESTTDAEGQFAFPDLVLDHYYIHVELDDGWGRALPRAMNLRADMTGNVGKVVVTPIE